MKKIEKSLSVNPSTIYFHDRPNEAHQTSHLFLNAHYYCKFKDEDEKEYISCTDYYHTHKLLLLGAIKEADIVHKIGSSEEIYEKAQELEKPYLNTDKWKNWEEKKVSVMKTAIKLKFEQHPRLLEGLLLTGDKRLIEDHPRDKFWGGTCLDAQNMMGRLLMELRESIISKRRIIPIDVEEKEVDKELILDDDKKKHNSEEIMNDYLLKLTMRKRHSMEVKHTAKLEHWELLDQAKRLLKQNPPLMYLNDSESSELLEKSKIEYIPSNEWLIKIKDPNDLNECFFIIKGEAFVYNESFYLEVVREGTLFGVDGPLFSKRFYKIMAGDNLAVLRISSKMLHKLTDKEAKFALNIGRNMLLKQHLFDGINKFKNYRFILYN